MNTLPTIVTALYDLGRSDLSGGFERSMDEYLQRMSQWMDIGNPMVIYTSPELRAAIRPMREGRPTVFKTLPFSAVLNNFPHKDITNRIRQEPAWQQQAGWLANSPQCRLEGYNPLVMSKLPWLAETAVENPFNSTHVFWLDAGITQTVHPGYFTHDQVLTDIAGLFPEFGFICYPYHPRQEVHGFDKAALASFAGVDRTDHVARGGFFGGPVSTLQHWNAIYTKLLEQSLGQGLMGTEESIFTIMTYRHREALCLYFIEGDGLLSTFFEGVKNKNPMRTPPVTSPEAEPQVIDDLTLSRWHEDCVIHLGAPLYDARAMLGDKTHVSIIDIGASTGRFARELSAYYTIERLIETEALEEAHRFAQEHGPPAIRLFGYPADQPQQLYLNRFEYHEGNLGIFTVTPYPEGPATPVPSIDSASFFKAAGTAGYDLIRIHTGGQGLAVLQWLEPLIAVWQHRPHILFDHDPYASRDELAAVLRRFQLLGYEHDDPYTYGGGNIRLFANREGTKTEDHPETKTSPSAHQTRTLYRPGPADARLSTYVITYNQPEQLRMLLRSFEENGMFLLYQTRRILLNNSDDPDTTQAYEELAGQYGFEHYRQENLGISGGRQWVADHFEAGNSDYMVFFEDDMLLAGRVDKPCKNGLNRYIPDLFHLLMKAMDEEKYDFIKLSFTEFFGDNASQWAWFNVPPEVRRELFPEQPERTENSVAPATRFDPPVFKNGLTLLTGEIYYCNWPHIISREANRRMFLDTRWHFPAEATWMSHFYQLTIQKKIKPAILLASTIRHHRAFHYEGSSRKEFSDSSDFTKNLIKDRDNE